MEFQNKIVGITGVGNVYGIGYAIARTFLHGILDANDTHERAVHGEIERGETLQLLRYLAPLLVAHFHVLVTHHEVLRADDDTLAVKRRREAVSDDVFHLGVSFPVLEVLLGSRLHYGPRHGMRVVLLETCGKP